MRLSHRNRHITAFLLASALLTPSSVSPTFAMSTAAQTDLARDACVFPSCSGALSGALNLASGLSNLSNVGAHGNLNNLSGLSSAALSSLSQNINISVGNLRSGVLGSASSFGNLSNLSGSMGNINGLASSLNMPNVGSTLNTYASDLPSVSTLNGNLSGIVTNFSGLSSGISSSLPTLTSLGRTNAGTLFNSLSSFNNTVSGLDTLSNNIGSLQNLSTGSGNVTNLAGLSALTTQLGALNNATSQMAGLGALSADTSGLATTLTRLQGLDLSDTSNLKDITQFNGQLTGINGDIAISSGQASLSTLNSVLSSSNISKLGTLGSSLGVPDFGSNLSTVLGNMAPGSSLTTLQTQLDNLTTKLTDGLNSTSFSSGVGLGGISTTTINSLASITDDQRAAINQLLVNIGYVSNSINALKDVTNTLSSSLGGLVGISGNTGSLTTAEQQAINGEISNFNKIAGNLAGLGNINSITGNLNDAISNFTNIGGGLANLGGLTANLSKINGALDTFNQSIGQVNGAIAGNLRTGLTSISNGLGVANGLGGGPTQDDTYKNASIIGAMKDVDNSGMVIPPSLQSNPTTAFDPGTQGVMPKNAMPNKDTPAMSLVQNFPFLWKEIDLKNPSTPGAYSGENLQFTLYRGTGFNTFYDVATPVLADLGDGFGVAASEDKLLGTGNAAAVAVNALDGPNGDKCKPITDRCYIPDPASSYIGDPESYEKFMRLQYDSCANQYILPFGAHPNVIFADALRNHQYPWNESLCQPLRMDHVDCVRDMFNGGCKKDTGSSDGNLYDYRAWGYLRRAWRDTMTDDYLPNTGIADKSGADAYGNEVGVSPVKHFDPTLPLPPFGVAHAAGDYPPNARLGGSGIGGDAILGAPKTGTFDYDHPGYDQTAYNAGAHGIQYNNNTTATQTQYTGALTNLNDLAQPGGWERIRDPSHPFSPRWDFGHDNPGFSTDRSYSKKAALKPVPAARLIVGGYDPSGITTGGDMGYDPVNIMPTPGADTCIVRCAAVPVDILSFRQQQFDACMSCRIRANADCFWSQVAFFQIPKKTPDCAVPDIYGGCLIPFAYPGISAQDAFQDTVDDKLPDACDPWPDYYGNCFQRGWQNLVPPDILPVDVANANVDKNCKYTHSQQNGQWPLCSTKFDYPNDPAGSASITLGLTLFPGVGGQKTISCATCTAESGDSNEADGVKKCCGDLAAALVPINTLKIRNLKSDPGLNPTPEGYRFQDYFDNHMPYMRWWDTGTAAGGTRDPLLNYDPCKMDGYQDTLVGVGTEGNGTEGPGGKYCRYGGNGTDSAEELTIYTPPPTGGNHGQATSGYECVPLNAPDALTSWTELKMYQLYSIRKFGLNCIAQYEKFNKEFAAEDGALFATGGFYLGAHVDLKDPTDPSAGTTGYQTLPRPWPLRWRGYLSDTTPGGVTATSTDCSQVGAGKRFPCLDADFANSGYMMTGLDNAQAGDIVYLTHDDVPPPGTTDNNLKVMPFIGVVTGTYKNPAPGKHDCSNWVEISDINNGKYPDACGDTNFMGFGQSRKIYKEWLPTQIYDLTYPDSTTIPTDSCGDSYTAHGLNDSMKITSTGLCSDPKLAACTFYHQVPGNPSNFNYWDHVRIYRPINDIRK